LFFFCFFRATKPTFISAEFSSCILTSSSIILFNSFIG
jgi:hypothetical protein